MFLLRFLAKHQDRFPRIKFLVDDGGNPQVKFDSC